MYQFQEYKYLVEKEQLETMRSAIIPFVKFDRFSKDRRFNEYTVRSIYFDSKKLECYNQKIEGIDIRKKIRIRTYNEENKNSMVFLEIKRKYLNSINKDRAPFKYKNMERVMAKKDIDKFILSPKNGKWGYDSARKFFYHIHKGPLFPKALVIYEREAYQCKFNSFLRITLDKKLRSSLNPKIHNIFSEDNIRYALPHYFIFEIKFYGGLPHWVQSIISLNQLKRLALSKYTICLDSHIKRRGYFPELFSNKFLMNHKD